ncbi:MAG: YraN family protein [Burkholderiaceae bacterium]|nr:YraN family protein [Sulfuritalea sp.]MCF8175917.1 YraN family protein [Burkholderiaceae bacterium]
MRRLVKHQRRIDGRERPNRRLASADFCRQEADKQKTRIGEPRRRQRRDGRTRPRQRDHPETCGAHRGHGACPGIGDTRRAGVRHQRHAAAFAQQAHQLGRRLVLVVLVQRQGRHLDAVVIEQLPGVAGVFAGDQIDTAQGFQRAQADVAQVSDRRGDDIQCIFHERHSCSPLSTRQGKGAAAEQLAADYLLRQGLLLVERNFRVRGGEIDLICRDGKTTVFVEVRLRSRADFGGAAASITSAKQARLILAARHWLQRHGETPCRFDCVLLDGLLPANGDSLEWLRGAFSAD